MMEKPLADLSLLVAAKWAESFIAGFEGDDMQNIDENLAVLREAIKAAEETGK